MARKNTLVHKLYDAPQSLSATFTTPATLIRYLDNISYQFNAVTTDSIGNFAVECSDDYAVNEAGVTSNPGIWVPLTLAGGVPFVNAGDADILIDLNQLPYIAVRVVYTATTPGTGTVEMYIVARQLGG